MERFLNGYLRYFRRRTCLGLMYHEIRPDSESYADWKAVRKSSFIKQMEIVRSHFRIVKIEQALREMKSDSGDSKPCSVLTFDDGYSGNYEVLLPIIQELEIPVIIFVSTEAIQSGRCYWFDDVISASQKGSANFQDLRGYHLGVYKFPGGSGEDNWEEIQKLLADLKRLRPEERERVLRAISPKGGEKINSVKPLTRSQLTELASSPYVEIGAHSHSHNMLTQLTAEEVEKDIRVNKDLLESWIKKPVDYFSYPNGDFSEKVIDVLKRLGFKCAFTTNAVFWKKRHSPYEIPRIGIGRYDSISRFKSKIYGVPFSISKN